MKYLNSYKIYNNNYLHHTIKKKIYILSFLVLIAGNLKGQTLTAEEIYEKVKDAVVVIFAYDYSDELVAQGSGVVLNDKGYVVTNYHVLSGNDRLEIMHGDEIIPYVDIIGIDVEKDILILKIEEKKFPLVYIGDVKKLKVGQRVYAIGSPMGFENTLSEGIISGLRSYDELNKNYIQITASISPGSSGGAVLNDKGELIGISTSSVVEGQNLNFAIPISDVFAVEISSYMKNNKYRIFDLYYLGINEYENGNYVKAIEFFSNYIKENQNDEGVYYNRGLAYDKLGNFSGAIKDYTKAIEIRPNYAAAYNNRAIIKGELEDYFGALKDFDLAIDFEPNVADFYINRGVLKSKILDNEGSIRDYTSAIGINPGDVKAYTYRGTEKYLLDDYEGAIMDFNVAIEIDPAEAGTLGAYYYRGVSKGWLEDYQGAIKDFNKTIEINPNDSYAYKYRGKAKFSLGDKLGACLDWSKAGELGNDSVYDLIREYCN